MLDGERGKAGVGDKVSAQVTVGEETAEDVAVAGSWRERRKLAKR